MAIDKIQSESINLADTFAFTGTVTGAGESNNQYFRAKLSSNQAPSNGADVKIICNTEDYDVGGNYDNSTGRFVPPNGKIFLIYLQASIGSDTSRNLQESRLQLWKNGSEIMQVRQDTWDINSNRMSPCLSTIVTGNGSDYYELYVNVYVGSGNTKVFATNTYFQGFLLTST